MDRSLLWPASVTLSCETALPAKYAFLKKTEAEHARNVALTFIVIISLFLATIIALFTEVLRRLETSTERGAV